jgi:hypothetical protein
MNHLMSCYTGFYNVRRGWQFSTRDLGFTFVSSERRVGCEFINQFSVLQTVYILTTKNVHIFIIFLADIFYEMRFVFDI